MTRRSIGGVEEIAEQPRRVVCAEAADRGEGWELCQVFSSSGHDQGIREGQTSTQFRRLKANV